MSVAVVRLYMLVFIAKDECVKKVSDEEMTQKEMFKCKISSDLVT